MLEEALELLHVAVGDRQEVGGVGRPFLHAPDGAQLHLELVPEALHASLDPDQVATVELRGEEVGVAERARRDGAAAVAQLDGEVGGAVAGGQPVLAAAGEHAVDFRAGAKFRNRRLLSCRGGHSGTVNPMPDVIWNDRRELRNPVLVCAFKGWNDAGEAATAAVNYMRDQFESFELARIDPEEFFDFTAVRPTVRLSEGRTREIEWPHNVFTAARVPGADGDVVMLHGIEPSLRWGRFTEGVVEVARDLDVRMVVTLGALLADVPHSRPVAITGLASDQALVEKLGFEQTRYEGPTGIVGVLHHAFAKASIPSASLWASVPHYVAAAPNPKVALALVRAFEGTVGLAVDAGELEEAAEDYERQVTAAVASDPEVKAFVERLETAMDEITEDAPAEEDLPSAETIASDFQRFLRQRRPDE